MATTPGHPPTGPDPDSPRPTRIQQLISLLPAAQRVLASHTADPDGLCQGCQEQWARLVPYPCTQAKWATSVTDGIPAPETLALLGVTLEAVNAGMV